MPALRRLPRARGRRRCRTRDRGGDPVTVSYDLEEDSLWGLGIGCSGAVDIRIERLEDDAITNAWLAMLEEGAAGALVTPLAEATGRLLVTARGTHGGLGS